MPEELLRELLKQGVIDEVKIKSLPADVLGNMKVLERELLAKGLAKEGDIIKAKSSILNIPVLDISSKKIDVDILRLVPESTVRRYLFIPIEKKGKEVLVGMVDPEDPEAQKALKFVALEGHFTPKIYIISRTDLDSGIRNYRNLGREVGTALEQLKKEIEKEKRAGGDKKISEEIKEIAAEAPITKVVAVIVRHAVQGGASDIHIEALEDRTRVRFRVDGILHSSIFLPSKVHAAVVARVKILSNLKIDETRKPQDGRFQTTIGENKIDFRVSAFPATYGEKVVLRILDPSSGVTSFEELGLEGRNLEIYKRAMKKPFGLVLITGPTGSGKSTTLYTTLSAVNSEAVNIVTLEDPVEYYIAGVSQSQIHPAIGFTFASGLRSILRQDPDIIMVGEIRDKETASLVTHAALTGHLVFSTLHTNNSLGIVPRLVNMSIEPYLLPPTLAAGVAQRLLRKLCQECKKELDPSPGVKKIIDETFARLPKEVVAKYNLKQTSKIYFSEGCEKCGGKGTKGRIAIFEVFEMTSQLEKIILGKISETILAEEALRQGMITMKEDGIMKALKGLVSMEELLRVVEN